jgi:hypothetical protein
MMGGKLSAGVVQTLLASIASSSPRLYESMD